MWGMGVITLDAQSLRYISIFEAATGAEVVDCIEYDGTVVFVLKQGHLRIALRNGGENVQKVRNLLNKRVMLVEYSPDPKRFIKNVFHRYRVRNVILRREGDHFNVVVEIDPRDKARAIGAGGKNLKMAKDIIKRHHPVENLVIQ